MRLLYVVGVPGAGKTRLLRQVCAGLARQHVSRPVAHVVLIDSGLILGAVLGKQRLGFGGTDTLAMDAQPRVLRWLALHPYPTMLGEGDRLANPGFFDGCRQAGIALSVVLLDTPPAIAAERRRRRATEQDERWLNGRYTKIKNLEPHVNVRLDGTRTPEQLADDLAAHPAVAALHPVSL